MVFDFGNPAIAEVAENHTFQIFFIFKELNLSKLDRFIPGQLFCMFMDGISLADRRRFIIQNKLSCDETICRNTEHEPFSIHLRKYSQGLLSDIHKAKDLHCYSVKLSTLKLGKDALDPSELEFSGFLLGQLVFDAKFLPEDILPG